MTNTRLAEWTPRSVRVGARLFVATVAGAALAVGSVHTLTLSVVTAAMGVATVLVWWNAEPMRPRQSATTLLLTGLGLTLYTAAQCVPIPTHWLAQIAPHNADVWSQALSPLRRPAPLWAPLSLDPTATRIEVLKGVAYLLTFVTALQIARRRAGVTFLSRAILSVGVLLALSALLHPAFGAHKLYGIWEPPSHDESVMRHLAPLLNPNNLAGYLNLAICFGLAASLSPEPHLPRPILSALVLFFVGTQIWIASRGGIATMVLGAAIVVAMSRLRQRHVPWKRLGISIATRVAAAAGAVMLVLGASEQATSELRDTDMSKLSLIAQALRMIPAYPWWGTGRGAFESAFPAFRHAETTHFQYVTYSHPEDVVAQWLVEWGLPIGIVGLVAVAVALRPGVALVRSTTATGAWSALVALTAQNLVDLGTEIPGVMIAAAVCAAIVAGGSAGHGPRGKVERWAAHPSAVAVAAAAMTALVVALTIPVVGHDLSEDRVSLYAASKQGASAPAMDALAAETMARHPAEPYLPFIVGAQHLDVGVSPVAWMGAVIQRARVYGPAHLVLARWFRSRSAAQARLEYRLAVEQAPELRFLVMEEAPHLAHSFDDAMELISGTDVGVLQLDALSAAVATRLPSTAVRLDQELARRAPSSVGPSLRAARAAVEDLEATGGAVWCEGEGARRNCERRALDLSSSVERAAPKACEGHVLRARARVATGDVGQGLKELSESLDEVDDRVSCLKALFQIAEGARNDEEATRALDKVISAGCSDDAACADNLAWAALAEDQRGNRLKALALYKRAYEQSPEGPDADDRLRAAAVLAASLGLHAAAADAYDQLAQRNPSNPAWAKAVVEQRQAAILRAVDARP